MKILIIEFHLEQTTLIVFFFFWRHYTNSFDGFIMSIGESKYATQHVLFLFFFFWRHYPNSFDVFIMSLGESKYAMQHVTPRLIHRVYKYDVNSS